MKCLLFTYCYQMIGIESNPLCEQIQLFHVVYCALLCFANLNAGDCSHRICGGNKVGNKSVQETSAFQKQRKRQLVLVKKLQMSTGDRGKQMKKLQLILSTRTVRKLQNCISQCNTDSSILPNFTRSLYQDDSFCIHACKYLKLHYFYFPFDFNVSKISQVGPKNFFCIIGNFRLLESILLHKL